MVKVVVSGLGRVCLDAVLGFQGGPGSGLRLSDIKSFMRISELICPSDEERKTFRSPDGKIEDVGAMRALESREIALDNEDARRLKFFLEGQFEPRRGDVEWIDPLLEQLKEK